MEGLVARANPPRKSMRQSDLETFFYRRNYHGNTKQCPYSGATQQDSYNEKRCAQAFLELFFVFIHIYYRIGG